MEQHLTFSDMIDRKVKAAQTRGLGQSLKEPANTKTAQSLCIFQTFP